MSDTTTETQRMRYQRRVWAAKHIGAQMTSETALTPMPMHGPERLDLTRADHAFAWVGLEFPGRA